MTDAKIIDMLKTGNFTILYHDNGSGTIYKGKYNSYGEVPEDAKTITDFGENGNGYLPKLVEWLTKALGGKSDSV